MRISILPVWFWSCDFPWQPSFDWLFYPNFRRFLRFIKSFLQNLFWHFWILKSKVADFLDVWHHFDIIYSLIFRLGILLEIHREGWALSPPPPPPPPHKQTKKHPDRIGLSSLSLPESSITWIVVFLTFKYVDESLVCNHSNESYWAVLSSGTVYMLYKVVQTFTSVDETLVCDHSNESYWAVWYCLFFHIKMKFEILIFSILSINTLGSERVRELLSKNYITYDVFLSLCRLLLLCWGTWWTWLMSCSIWIMSWWITPLTMSKVSMLFSFH